MASVPAPKSPASELVPAGGPSTARWKLTPPTRELRERIRRAVEAEAAAMGRHGPVSRGDLERRARRTLQQLGLPEGYLGWTMVALASAFWRDEVAAAPTNRRLLLLPHCLRNDAACRAPYRGAGLDCSSCGACVIGEWRREAERLGYRVLVADGSPAAMQLVLHGTADAILGVACLNVLEKAFDKVLRAGVPCMAVPLLSGDCRRTATDDGWVLEMIRLRRSARRAARAAYVPVMRAAVRMFSPDRLRRLAPPARGAPPLDDGPDRIDPLAGAEALAYDFLSKGGKYARPFITLAVYHALTGGAADGEREGGPGDGEEAAFPEPVQRAALSVEAFHKASLIHDDIEDDDERRYGELAMHRKYGAATAINTGDYLIGLGYRFIAREAAALGAQTACDIVAYLADAHTRLAEGQGAELLWRDARDKRLTPLEALKIYALKTAPAFEAALAMGVRLVRPLDGMAEPLRRFARNLGVAFQILNDLKDWEGDAANRRRAGGDVLGGRPTLLWALALEALPEAEQQELLELAAGRENAEARLDRVAQLYRKAGVFAKAAQLVEKHRERAEQAAESLEPASLRGLLRFLIDAVLDQPSGGMGAAAGANVSPLLPIAPP